PPRLAERPLIRLTPVREASARPGRQPAAAPWRIRVLGVEAESPEDVQFASIVKLTQHVIWNQADRFCRSAELRPELRCALAEMLTSRRLSIDRLPRRRIRFARWLRRRARGFGVDGL